MHNLDILDHLNENQKYAVTYPRKPLLVLAGPGTGKTRTLISRIIYNINHFKIAPDQVLALTFSNKAANEMKFRLEQSLGDKTKKLFIGTFHSFCTKILRKYYEIAELDKFFTVCDENYQQRLIESLLSAYMHSDLSKKAKGILLAFSNYQLKNKSLPPFSAKLYDEYSAHLTKYKLLDFNQILTRTARLFRENPDILDQYRFLYQSIHVDEFQDTDPVQYQILHDLAIKHRNIFVVADDDQSIYAWRGANPDNIRQYMEDFYIERPVFLNVNYRSGAVIMNTAQSIVENTDRIEPNKEITSLESISSNISALFFKDESQELKYIFDKITNWNKNLKIPYSNIAVLYPRHIFGEKLSELFIKKRIPYQLVQGKNLIENPLTRLIILYLKLIREPADSLILEELAELELGQHDFKQLYSFMKAQNLTFRAALQQFNVRPEISYKLKNKISTFIGHIANLVNLKNFFSFDSLINEIIKGSREIHHSQLERHSTKLSEFKAYTQINPSNIGQRIWIFHENDKLLFVAKHMLEVIFGKRVHYLSHESMEQVNKDDVALLMSPFISSNILCPAEALYGQVSPVRKGIMSNLFRWVQLQIKSNSKAIFNKYVVFDLETTSKDPEQCGIVELAAVKIVNGKIADEFQTLINPEMPIDPEAQAVHQISEKDLRNAPNIKAVWPKFKEFIKNELLIAHNGFYFDFKITDRVAKELDKSRLKNIRYDSLILARNIFPNQQNSIDALAERFKIDTGSRHRALDDVKALHLIFERLLNINDLWDSKSAGEEFTEFVCLGNIIENEITAVEDKIFYMAGISKLLSPYSKILSPYIKKFGLDRENVTDSINNQAKRILPSFNLYANNEAYLKRILDMAVEFKPLPVDQAIAEFLTYLSLLNPQDHMSAIDAVSLLTLHSAKGLEFDRTIIMGMEDENIPSYFSYQTNDDDDRPVSKKIEEQKRLLYVGITRAKEEVIFTVVKNRFGRKQKSSPFLEEIKDKIKLNYYH
ncbi:MAG: UvrD-helicase domain-containing protein [Calditrichaceae bacterium]|nr:UvrD-helicase domain-containing protein [Calditrichaceae bacterium]MBN2708331.1 UvrD-helicase domain-containing protein [Calditrichaceae bacterium]RQV95220.1 MAG: hypothetical protein EH224_08050 [Calditrichota bacterium]